MSMVKNPPDRRLAWPRLAAVLLLAGLIALPRMLPFPASFLTYDEMKIGAWVSEMTRALLDGDWAGTAIPNNPYPAVSLAWLEAPQAAGQRSLPAGAQMLSAENDDVFATLPRRRLVLAGLNSLVVLVMFWLLRRLYSPFVAVTATILIALDPFLLTESRVYRAEGLTTGLMMLSALLLILYARERRRAWLVTSAVLAGLAVLTRISALFMFPYAGLVLLAWPLLAGERRPGALLKQVLGPVLAWSLLAGVTFAGLWPALWASPQAGPEQLYAALAPVFADTGRVWPAGVFFLGRAMGEVDPGPWFYLWALAYRTTPLLWLGLAALLVRREPDRRVTLLLLAYLAAYFTAINLSATKIDRYLVAMLPALSILAGLGLDGLARRLWPGGVAGWRQGLVWAALLLAAAWFCLPHHPYYYTYWNPWLGGGRAAVRALPAMGRQGIDELVDYLNAQPDAAGLTLAGTGLDLDYVQECPAIFAGNCVWYPQFLASDYFLMSVYSAQNGVNLANIKTVLPDVEVARTYRKDGVDYAWLYKMPANLFYVGHWLDYYAGVFSGYRLSAGQVGAGDSLEVTLFWQNGERSGWRFDNSDLFVELVDETGQAWQSATARLKPEFEPLLPKPNEILVFSAPLRLAPDTPPGRYQLAVGLRLRATGEETLRFPLPAPGNVITVNRGALNAGSVPVLFRLDRPLGQTGLTLAGYSGPAAGRFYLYWRADRPAAENYRLHLVALDGQGRTLAAWLRPLAPEAHPVTAWQPGELVTVPFPLEAGRALAAPDKVVLSLLPESGPAEPPLASVTLAAGGAPPAVTRPEGAWQHHLNDITFGPYLDLLGYDLAGRGSLAGGRLVLTLYWLNRQPGQPVEVEVRAVGPDGASLAEQVWPVPAPAGFLSGQSRSQIELALAALPAALQLRARPAGGAWYPLLGDDRGEVLVIDDVLDKAVIIPDE